MRPSGGARVFPVVRSSHLEALPDGEILYFEAHSDLRGMELPSRARQVNTWTALRLLRRDGRPTIELWEPFWMRYLPKWLLLATWWRLLGILRRRQNVIVCYAIENNDPERLLGPRLSRLPGVVRDAILSVLGRLVSLLVTRLVFGSESSAALYSRLMPARAGQERREILELPTARAVVAEDKAPLTTMFVGALEPRKGIDDLLDAWAQVEERVPGAVLAIVGTGELSQGVRSWAEAAPRSRCAIGPLPRAEVIQWLRHASVLAAPSKRVGRWREQIGLPISEALSCGCTIVTTTETGLASYLVDHGHKVIEPGQPRALADALEAALSNPLPVGEVLSALPPIAGRSEADRWLHRDV
jgi:glycosyltransferase involved in cell wall biosynthesis